jgi:hypothetical protein
MTACMVVVTSPVVGACIQRPDLDYFVVVTCPHPASFSRLTVLYVDAQKIISASRYRDDHGKELI